MKLNILHITPDFNYTCGRSYYVFLLLKYLNLHKHNAILLTNGGDSLERVEKHNIPAVIIKSLNSKNPVAFAKNLRVLKKLLEEKNIDIIHSHHRYSELLAVQASRLYSKKKVKSVFTSLSLVGRRYNIEYRSDKIIAVSKTIKKMLIERFKVSEKKISVIHNFTDTEELIQPGILDKEKNKKYFNILSIGRFHKEKNFELLLRALYILNDNLIKLTLIGEGDRFKYYKNYIDKYKLNVELKEPQKDLSDYFSIADLCVLPSVKDPFPNFMLQSGLHKKPFIGSKTDGIAELIIDNHNGFLFESGNETQLAQKIDFLKSNKELAKKCADNLHNEVIKGYTQETIIPKIEKIYRDLIET